MYAWKSVLSQMISSLLCRSSGILHRFRLAAALRCGAEVVDRPVPGDEVAVAADYRGSRGKAADVGHLRGDLLDVPAEV